VSRRRYVYRPDPDTGEIVAIEVSNDYEPPVRVQVSMDRHYENTCATDGTDIGSRRKHREYMKRNNLAPSDDFKETWKKSAEQRERVRQGDFDHRARRETLERAFHKLRKP
jgi:hypothetical protein